MAKRKIAERTNAFAWPTKQELYDYFEHMHGIGRATVDAEIERVRASFRLRQGQPINPQELWEKVGRNLEATVESD